jgi:hypothetical protein
MLTYMAGTLKVSCEHDLGHALSVGLGVEWGLGEENWVFLRSDTELVVKGVVPDLLHVIPVGDDPVLNGVLEGQDTSLGLGFITNIGILLVHTDHDTRVLGSPNNGWKDSSWSIISSETSFAHPRTVIHNKSLHVVVSHFSF